MSSYSEGERTPAPGKQKTGTEEGKGVESVKDPEKGVKPADNSKSCRKWIVLLFLVLTLAIIAGSIFVAIFVSSDVQSSPKGT